MNKGKPWRQRWEDAYSGSENNEEFRTGSSRVVASTKISAFRKKEKPVQDSLTKSNELATVLFTDRAFAKMSALVMMCDIEVGWHGFGKKLDERKYLIEDIKIYPQKTTGSTIDCDTEKFGAWEQMLLLEDMELADKRCFHGHSHVNMATFSSATDRDLQDDIIEMLGAKDDGFYIFLIFNKRANCYFKIADREDGCIYENVKIDTESGALLEMAKEYGENVKEQKYSRYGNNTYYYH